MGDRRSSASLHFNFFSSLKQVEKRLKLEHPSEQCTQSPLSSQLLESNKSLTESLSSPIYLDLDHSNNNNYSCNTLQESSEAPEAFLSCSPQFLPTQLNALQQSETISDTGAQAVDDIEQLIQLLSLSNSQEGEEDLDWKCGGTSSGGNSCQCEGGFYEKIVGVRGPKCGKELERLEGWINYFLNGGVEGRIEPFRLAHLILGKAAFVSEGADHGSFGGLEFPSTIREFLHNDPPIEQ